MKHFSFTNLLLFLTAITMATLSSSAFAATASLQHQRIGDDIDMGLTVVIAGPGTAYWSSAEYNCNGPGLTTRRQTKSVWYVGPGTFSSDYDPYANPPIDEWGHFLDLPNGSYTLYAVARGMRIDVFPYQPWAASTGDTTVTIP